MFESILLNTALALGQGAGAPSAGALPPPGSLTGQSSPFVTAGPTSPAQTEEEETPTYLFMRSLEGTGVGNWMKENNLSVTGWLVGSYNFSSAAQNNLPFAWTDRANEAMLQQAWIRLGKAIDTKKDEFQIGFQVDAYYGSDYRFTLPRGFFNGQLQNANGQQNIYGFDSPQHYVSAYIPGLFEGTEIRVGRLYTPWGVESIEAPSDPFITRSYAFNSAPPFTHAGVGAYITFNDNWSGTFIVANGNDIYWGAAAQEWRAVYALKWASDKDFTDTITVAGSVGRGAFNQGAPYVAPTAALPNEPLGRNNFNAFDVVWTHKFNCRLSTAVEAIYGYQTNVPVAAAPGLAGPGTGTAHWASLAGFAFYKVNDQLTLDARLEGFDDFQGQRTGFEGLYLSATTGFNFVPAPGIVFRTEARYDHNVETRPFEGDPGVFALMGEVILRF